MILILILMSLSSVNIIRNSSFDLFQILHRLSVIFVLLLFLHPSSHVLKEQVNVDRHHPDFCYDKLDILLNQLNFASITNKTTVAAAIAIANTTQHESNVAIATRANSTAALSRHRMARETTNINLEEDSPIEFPVLDDDNNNHKSTKSNVISYESASKATTTTPTSDNITRNHENKEPLHSTATLKQESFLCLDPLPLFVAQSSICCYVLSIGLSCYLLDLLLRKCRRSKSPIELLDVRSDSEGNLIELILSNNHKRFAHWLPGQFVYLNCPRIAAFEWHPFTISSMDNESRQFTLHIKTGGDWTRKLRRVLECVGENGSSGMCNSMSLDSISHQYGLKTNRSHYELSAARGQSPAKITSSVDSSTADSAPLEVKFKSNLRLDDPVLPNFDCYSNKTGEWRIQCTKLTHQDSTRNEQQCTSLPGNNNQNNHHDHQRTTGSNGRDWVEVSLGNFAGHNGQTKDVDLASKVCQWSTGGPQFGTIRSREANLSLKLFIDGPFHSPFERLLDQEVSVCIANGVGWTAFSSVFQCITNNLDESRMLSGSGSDVWWTQWRRFAYRNPRCSRRLTNMSNFTSASPSIGGFDNNNNDKQLQMTEQEPCRITSERCTGDNKQQSRFGLFGDLTTTGSELVGGGSKSNQTSALNIRRLLETRLHLMIIVTSIEQLKPFYNLAINYFSRIQDEYEQLQGEGLNPIREIRAFLTRSTKDDSDLMEFCRHDNLTWTSEDVIKVNEKFTIHLAKPELHPYLSKFRHLYSDRRKISVYCCGSYQVKKQVRETCANLNELSSSLSALTQSGNCNQIPVYSYHEENF